MKRIRYSSYVLRGLALGVLAMTAVGCCDAEKKQIEALQGEYNLLAKKNQETEAALAVARSRESQFMGQLESIESKDTIIAALQTENRELKSRLAKPAPGPGPVRPGAETTVYTESVGTDVLFSAGRASLTAAGRKRLDAIVSTLKSKYAGMTVRVMGYTDKDPIVKTKNLWKDNLDLSANRAMEVTRYLWSRGIPAERIETVGMGATHFVGSNATKSGKAANRRVEILVVKK
jgi:outer membrane protein OmpA-like peptidoglycan-associated protein